MSSRDPKEWMWAEACVLLERAERLHRQFFTIARGSAQAAWEPPVDIFETDRDFWVIVALPGVSLSNIRLTIGPDSLHIAAERPLPPFFRQAAVHRIELPYGRFERTVELPAGPVTFETQEMLNGCLVVALRKQF
jgi:HSP20 family protein